MSTYLFVGLPVSLSVCLSKGILPLASDLFKLRHCLGLKHNFFRDNPSQNSPNWSILRKNVVVAFDHPGSSGGKRVYPVFQELGA